jgi:hypothetical protein
MLRAICITNGEQGENHAGMQKIGKGLAKNGYTLEDAIKFKEKFEKMGGKAILYDLKEECLGERKDECKEDAYLLKFEDGVNVLFKNKIIKEIENIINSGKKISDKNKKKCYDIILSKFNATKLFEEQFTFEWDKKYWDTRRSKVLNKHARHNVCYGKIRQEPDYENKKGTIVSYSQLKIMRSWRKELLKLVEEKDSDFIAEGNLYYDVKKTGIGFHGDAERRKVVAGNFCDEGVTRELNFIAYFKGQRIGKRFRLILNNGDMYIMIGGAAGTDWKKRNKITFRHAAGVEGSKYLK